MPLLSSVTSEPISPKSRKKSKERRSTKTHDALPLLPAQFAAASRSSDGIVLIHFYMAVSTSGQSHQTLLEKIAHKAALQLVICLVTTGILCLCLLHTPHLQCITSSIPLPYPCLLFLLSIPALHTCTIHPSVPSPTQGLHLQPFYPNATRLISKHSPAPFSFNVIYRVLAGSHIKSNCLQHISMHTQFNTFLGKGHPSKASMCLTSEQHYRHLCLFSP